MRQETQEFNQTFWVQHNAEFTSGREQHIAQVLKEKYENDVAKTTISAEEMSVYYKKFLDSKWRSHIDYNLEWQKRNFSILFLGNFQKNCLKSSSFVQKFNFDFPRKLSILFGWKTRENGVVLYFLAVDNFVFTRKVDKKKLSGKTRENVGVMSKLNFWTK